MSRSSCKPLLLCYSHRVALAINPAISPSLAHDGVIYIAIAVAVVIGSVVKNLLQSDFITRMLRVEEMSLSAEYLTFHHSVPSDGHSLSAVSTESVVFRRVAEHIT